MENCPAKKAVAGKEAEEEVGEMMMGVVWGWGWEERGPWLLEEEGWGMGFGMWGGGWGYDWRWNEKPVSTSMPARVTGSILAGRAAGVGVGLCWAPEGEAKKQAHI